MTSKPMVLKKHCKRVKKLELSTAAAPDFEHPEPCTVVLTDRAKTIVNILDLNSQAALDLLPDVDEATGLLFESLRAGDAYLEKLCTFVRGIADARRSMLKSSIQEARQCFQSVVDTYKWRQASNQAIFSVLSRQRIGTKFDCFFTYGLEELKKVSPFLATLFKDNHSLLSSAIELVVIPLITIDMTKLSSLDLLPEPLPDAISRTAEFSFDRHVRQTLLKPELLLLVGSLLLPPCLHSHKWKTMIVASGSRFKSHIIDKICTELVDLGLTYDPKELGVKRTQPYVLYISDWSASWLPVIKSKLHAGMAVIIRSELGVPADICLDNELRLHTVHINGVTGGVSDSSWNVMKESVLLNAIEAYKDHAEAVPVPRIPFLTPEAMIPYRPVPRASIAACLLSEMLHGLVDVRISPGGSAELTDIEERYALYAKKRGFLDLYISVESILEGCSMLQNTVDDIVRFCAASKVFENLEVSRNHEEQNENV